MYTFRKACHVNTNNWFGGAYIQVGINTLPLRHMSIETSEVTVNGIIFYVLFRLAANESSKPHFTDHLGMESTGHRWIPITGTSKVESVP